MCRFLKSVLPLQGVTGSWTSMTYPILNKRYIKGSGVLSSSGRVVLRECFQGVDGGRVVILGG